MKYKIFHLAILAFFLFAAITEDLSGQNKTVVSIKPKSIVFDFEPNGMISVSFLVIDTLSKSFGKTLGYALILVGKTDGREYKIEFPSLDPKKVNEGWQVDGFCPNPTNKLVLNEKEKLDFDLRIKVWIVEEDDFQNAAEKSQIKDSIAPPPKKEEPVIVQNIISDTPKKEKSSMLSKLPSRILISVIAPGLPVIYSNKAPVHAYLSLASTYVGLGLVYVKNRQLTSVIQNYYSSQNVEEALKYSTEKTKVDKQLRNLSIIPISGWTLGMLFTILDYVKKKPQADHVSNWQINFGIDEQFGVPSVGLLYNLHPIN